MSDVLIFLGSALPTLGRLRPGIVRALRHIRGGYTGILALKDGSSLVELQIPRGHKDFQLVPSNEVVVVQYDDPQIEEKRDDQAG